MSMYSRTVCGNCMWCMIADDYNRESLPVIAFHPMCRRMPQWVPVNLRQLACGCWEKEPRERDIVDGPVVIPYRPPDGQNCPADLPFLELPMMPSWKDCRREWRANSGFWGFLEEMGDQTCL